MHLQDSSEDFTSPHLFSFMENQSGLRRERVQVCRHRTHDIYTHMHTHVHTSIRKKNMLRSLAQDFCVTPELELRGLDLPKSRSIFLSSSPSPCWHQRPMFKTRAKWGFLGNCRLFAETQLTAVEIAYSDLSREAAEKFLTPVNPNNLTFIWEEVRHQMCWDDQKTDSDLSHLKAENNIFKMQL